MCSLDHERRNHAHQSFLFGQFQYQVVKHLGSWIARLNKFNVVQCLSQ